MIPENLTFKALKERVNIAQVLYARNAMSGLRREGNRLVGPCPVHHGDNPRAFVADLDRGLWRCFTMCNGGGDVVDLVRRLDGTGYHEARQALAVIAGIAPPFIPPRPVARSTPSTFRPFVRQLPLDPDVPFLQRKGIRRDTAHRFETGRWSGPGFLAGCIGVRLHDLAGRPLGYAGRRLDVAEAVSLGKWKFPRDFPKRDVLYNAHRISRTARQAVVVVECAWGVMRLSQLGFPAVALLGTAMTPNQRAALQDSGPVVLLLDGDAAGRQAASHIASQLPAQVVSLPEGKDPDDLVDDDIISLLSPFFSS